MVATFRAPFTPRDGLVASLRTRGFAILEPIEVAALAGVPLDALDALAASWNDLPPDEYLRDGGRYRQRRHACFVTGVDGIEQAPPRAHYQPLDYNALHGGLHRWFAPIAPETVVATAWEPLLRALGDRLREVRPADPWYVEAHQFRIDTADGIGRPTPEGAHRDGVDFVAVFIVGRHAIRGGETRIFEADGPDGQRFTLTEPWSLLLLDDRRMIHETTPIQPVQTEPSAGADAAAGPGYRDTLVVTYRADGFQAEA